jgi:tetratricopeptide (TPR) repeat protein
VELLAFGSGYGSAHGSGAVRALQHRLAGLVYATGPIDGRYGPLTEQAVRRFQATHGLIVDGIDGPVTRAALASAHLVLRPGDGSVPGGIGPVRALQRHLAAAGFSPGPIDGRYGPLTERAVRRFQAARHLRVDGFAGPQTLGRLRGAPRHQVHQPPSPRSGAHHRPARSPTRPPRPPKTRPRARHPGGVSLAPWLIVLAGLILTALTGLVWHGRRRRDGDVPVVPVGADADSGPVAEPVSKPVSEPAAEPAAALPDPTLPEDPDAGAGVFRLARALAEAGKLAPAVDALRRADRLGHPGAALELGLLLAQQGDLAAARDALLRADQRGHPDAAFELGELLEQQGDGANAQQAYRLGDARGHAGAAFNLGVLLLRGGDVAEAEDAFRRADERGHPGAASNLGVLLEERGDFAGGRAAYERADQRGEAVGAYNLGLLLEQDGDIEPAKAAFHRAEERGEPAGALGLGRLLEQVGDREGARRAFQRAGQVGPPEVAEFAHAALRELHADSEEADR